MRDAADPALFWQSVFAYRGSAGPHVLPRVLVLAGIAALVTLAHRYVPAIAIPVGPIEVCGAALALILILRTNAGYDRWWEGRKLWGGIVNQTRNLTAVALAYGPEEASWREQVVRWSAAFAHAARRSLRGERDVPELAALVGGEAAKEVARAQHMPSFVAKRLASLLHEARRAGMDGFAFAQGERERALLIDHLGGCERIVKTPLAYPYAVAIRRFLVAYLVLTPFGLLDSAGWATPLVTLMIASPILGLDHIGTELQNPFSPRALGHLPLDEICATIQSNVTAALDASRGPLL